ncbi:MULTISPECIES: RNA polymerase sigma factor [Pedobacter]|uniref:DNA-directed RNA polymerase sigma-70 factor n=1 Tax=Pedobacter zeae TaxID=1737356 RepID=A0A7W6KAQ3_9SPHI|nr:sigma-70 family RNA polymerase sigma factor [Pedobacter zeae]MBB4108190.1 RNA polymerase sigma-70 factor (ECF subfamily) [Pedobacter zeae]GGG94445.1 DNA-directed RNA polymerase sigma-70 factor [Pedobacter zeae]
MQEEDQILLDELQSGHKTAHERVFKKYYRALALKAFLILDDEMEAEDVVQNLFVEMWQKNHYRSVKSSLKSYLFRAVHNQCLMVLRKKKSTQRQLEVYTQSLVQETEEQGQREVPNDLREQQVKTIFNELSIQRQKAFKLVHIDHKKYQEAADEMGVSINSVKTHLKLAVKVLQKKLINLK